MAGLFAFLVVSFNYHPQLSNRCFASSAIAAPDSPARRNFAKSPLVCPDTGRAVLEMAVTRPLPVLFYGNFQPQKLPGVACLTSLQTRPITLPVRQIGAVAFG
jgi:hypothetical protein